MGTLSISAMSTFIGFLVYYVILVSVSAENLGSQIDMTKTHQLPSSLSRGNVANYKRYLRSSSLLGGTNGQRQVQISHSKIPIELDLLLDDDELFDKTKRYDDYGHMRFGKRGGEEQFDDYGHMRFGKRSE